MTTSSLRRFAPPLLLAGAAWAGVQLLNTGSEDRLGRELAAAARPGDIVMLSSQTCPYCTQARLWLTRHRVSFSECFIERDAACAARYEALQSPGTPTLILVTHHVEEILPCFTHALCLRDGAAVASGEIGKTLTTANLRKTFGAAVSLSKKSGRYALGVKADAEHAA